MKTALTDCEIRAEQATLLLAKKDQLIDRQSIIISKKSDVIATQKQRIELLEEYLRLERARLYGRSSEKNAHQGELFDEAELCCDDSEEESQPEPIKKETSTIKSGRKGLSKSLPRHQIHIDLSDEEKVEAIDTFYSVVKEELDIEPAKARVIEYLQEKAVFVEQGARQIKAAKLPKHPLPKVIASVGLLSFIIVFKILRWPTALSSGKYSQALRR